MSQTIRISDSLHALAQREAELMSRTVAQQLEHWARLGLALEASGVTASQVRHLLDLELGRRLERRAPHREGAALPAALGAAASNAYRDDFDDEAEAWTERDAPGGRGAAAAAAAPAPAPAAPAPAAAAAAAGGDDAADGEFDDDYSDEEIAVAITCISGVLSLEEGADEADISERELRRLMAGLLRRRRQMSLSELEALEPERRLQLATEIAFAEHAARGRR